MRAYVTAMRGCDKFCAFCVVPYTRGRERTIPPHDLMREIGELAERGVRRSCCSGRPSMRTVSTSRLRRAATMIATIDGIERIRFTSPHPSDTTDSAHRCDGDGAEGAALLHLPLQSGSDAMLAAMERGYTVDEYLALVAKLRSCDPGSRYSTDIIVGFTARRIRTSSHPRCDALSQLRLRLHLQVFRPRTHPRVQTWRYRQSEDEKGAPAE